MRMDDLAGTARWLWHEVDPGDWSGEALRLQAEGRCHLVPIKDH
ncbi:hypothetical protein [Sphaerisporangium aureirubrum]|uniref:Uncharacterized protein n=1 Tax=Sphaerisporangium aureirubrum TaxID=1544736 RepID=A0ABW1NA31_9ACTN